MVENGFVDFFRLDLINVSPCLPSTYPPHTYTHKTKKNRIPGLHFKKTLDFSNGIGNIVVYL